MCFDWNFIATPLLTKSPNAINFCFFYLLYVFASIFCFRLFPYWNYYRNFTGLTHSNPSKSINQVTLSNEHTNVYFPSCISCWPKEGRVWMRPIVAFVVWHFGQSKIWLEKGYTEYINRACYSYKFEPFKCFV